MKKILLMLGIFLATLVTTAQTDDLRFRIDMLSYQEMVEGEWETIHDKVSASGLIILNGRRIHVYLGDETFVYDQVSNLTEFEEEDYKSTQGYFIDCEGDRARIEIANFYVFEGKRLIFGIYYSNIRIYYSADLIKAIN